MAHFISFQPCRCPKKSKCFADFLDPSAELHAGVRYKYKCESKEELDNFERIKHSFDQGLYFPEVNLKALEEIAKEEGEGVALE